MKFIKVHIDSEFLFSRSFLVKCSGHRLQLFYYFLTYIFKFPAFILHELSHICMMCILLIKPTELYYHFFRGKETENQLELHPYGLKIQFNVKYISAILVSTAPEISRCSIILSAFIFPNIFTVVLGCYTLFVTTFIGMSKQDIDSLKYNSKQLKILIKNKLK